jgi:hypothetical protein
VIAGLPAARLVDPLLADYAEAEVAVTTFLDDAERLAGDASRLSTALAEPAGGLGRFNAGGS